MSGISSYSPVSVRRAVWRRGEGRDEGGFEGGIFAL